MSIEPFFDCRDIAVSPDYYTKVLDFELAVVPAPDPQQFGSRYAAVSRNGDIHHLSSQSRENGAFGSAIYVRVNDVDKLCERYVANGIKLTVPDGGTAPVDQTWGMREIGFRDPDGNKLTFGQTIP